jgi:hypothetical protein
MHACYSVFTNAVYPIRSLRRRRRRLRTVLIILFLAVVVIVLPSSLRMSRRAEIAAYDASIAHLPPPRVFIAAMLTNCAPLLSKYWIPSLLGLIDTLGHKNVYVSILENWSKDETREVLMELQMHLTQRNVPNSFRFEGGVHNGATFPKDGLLDRLLGKEGSGDNWIKRDGKWEPRRICYLAQLRNMVLEPLQNSSRQYDKVLFINDVIFSVFPT